MNTTEIKPSFSKLRKQKAFLDKQKAKEDRKAEREAIKQALEEAKKKGVKRISTSPKIGKCGYKTGKYKNKKVRIIFGLNTNSM